MVPSSKWNRYYYRGGQEDAKANGPGTAATKQTVTFLICICLFYYFYFKNIIFISITKRCLFPQYNL